MIKFTKVEPKHVIFVLLLLLLLNIFDAIFTLYAMDKYAVPEQNGFVAMLMAHGSFPFIKIVLLPFIGLLILKGIKKFNDKQCLQAFVVGMFGVLFYIVINVLNILFIHYYYGGK